MQKITWNTDEFNGLNIQKMFESPSFKEIMITMQAGSEMKEHSAPGFIIVQVLSGEIDFYVGDELINLKSLESVSLEPNVSHSLKARANSIIRLSLSKNDSANRVFKLFG